jgi:hypothetical protein
MRVAVCHLEEPAAPPLTCHHGQLSNLDLRSGRHCAIEPLQQAYSSATSGFYSSGRLHNVDVVGKRQDRAEGRVPQAADGGCIA